MGYATVEGRNIYYQYPQEAEAHIKKGQTVLLVHGAYDNHKVWSAQYQYLERDHTPLALDLPGHGESQGPGISNSKGFREFIKAFVDVMGLTSFVFAGHSMGGSMALDYTLHYPEALEGLILVGSAPKWDDSEELIEMWKADPERARSSNMSYLFSQKTSDHIRKRYEEQLRATPDDVCLADIENCVSYDLVTKLNKIDPPALVICGEEEEWIDGSRAIHAGLPHSTFEVVPDAGHAILVEQPDRLNAAIGSYLATLP